MVPVKKCLEKKPLVIANECIKGFFIAIMRLKLDKKGWGFIRNVTKKTIKILKNKKILTVQNSKQNAMGGVKSLTSAK